MKNQYFGDVNDYEKYGLLRALSRRLTVAVIWMLTPDDGSNDGRKTRYLEKGLIGDHDRELFEWLTRWYREGASRDVRLIEESGFLPNCRFFNDIVPDDLSSRAAWAARARGFSRECDLVFFDPDNGLPVSSTRAGTRGSSKYVALDEVKSAYDDGHSVFIYQHTARVNRPVFIEAKLRQLHDLTAIDRIFSFSSFDWIGFLLSQRAHFVELSLAEDEIRSQWHGRIHTEVNRMIPVRRERDVDRIPRRAGRTSKGTTAVGYVNPRGQEVIRRTDLAGTDHGQRVYVLRCGGCEHEYGANGSDIFRRRCPACQNGASGLSYEGVLK